MLLHGNGGGTSGGSFSLLPDGARWDRENASIRALCTGANNITLGPASLTFETQDLPHAVYGRSPMLSHTTLEVSQRCTLSHFLTLLFPERAGVSMPDMGLVAVNPESGGTGLRLALGDTTDVCFIKQRGVTLSLTEGGATITSDADLAWARILPDGALGDCFFINGTSFSHSAGTRVSLSTPGNLYTDFHNPRFIAGYVQTDGGNVITLQGCAPTRVAFRGSEIPFTHIPEGVSFAVNGDGAWSAEIEILPPSNLTAEDIPNDHGHRLRLAWTASPSEREGLVERYRIYRSRSSELTDPIPLSRFSSLDSLLFYEERYTILIDSVAVGTTEFIDPFIPLNNVQYHYWVQAVGKSAASKPAPLSMPVSVSERPREFRLAPAFPNPFNPFTTITFELPERLRAALTIYDILGRKVATLHDGILGEGEHSIRWDAGDLPSGVYFYTLQAGEFVQTGRAALVK